MYKLEINFSNWGVAKVVVEANDFNVLQVLQKFIEWQIDQDWLGEYEALEEEFDEESDEESEEELDEESEEESEEDSK